MNAHAIQILDLFHSKENVYGYAKPKFNQDSTKYVPWVEMISEKLESGNVDEVISGLPIKENMPAGFVNLRTYLENNREKGNYLEYKRGGFLVGSDTIESANKVIIQRRLQQAGMRWGVLGSQYVLTLRAKVESGLWYKATRFCA